MQDPMLRQPELEPRFTCPECGALLMDQVALDAHREQEHVAEAEGTAARPETEVEKAERLHDVLEGDRPADTGDYGRDSPRPREPAP